MSAAQDRRHAREEGQRRRLAREALAARVVEIALRDQISLEALSERFGLGDGTAAAMLRRAGVKHVGPDGETNWVRHG